MKCLRSIGTNNFENEPIACRTMRRKEIENTKTAI